MEPLAAVQAVSDAAGRVLGFVRAIESAYNAAQQNETYVTRKFNELYKVGNRINANLQRLSLCQAGAGSPGRGLYDNINLGLVELDELLYSVYEQVFQLTRLSW
jgi:hypothetical protein